MNISDFNNLGAVAGAVVVVFLFLRFLADEKERDRVTWGNHLSGTVQALTELVAEQRRQGEEARNHYRGNP